MFRALPIWILSAGLPIIAVLFLTLRGIEGDLAKERYQRVALAQDQISTAAHKIEDAVSSYMTEEFKTFSEYSREVNFDSDAIRTYLNSHEIKFAAIFDVNERLFPPLESAMMTPHESQILTYIAGALAHARSQTKSDKMFWEWMHFSTNQWLLLCNQMEDRTHFLCILNDFTEINLRLAQTQRTLLSDAKTHSLVLLDPLGLPRNSTHPLNSNSVLASHFFDGSLNGWQLKLLSASQTQQSGEIWRSYLSIGLPLTALWAVTILYIYYRKKNQNERRQQQLALSAQLSHDLKTPLANLHLHMDLIQKCKFDPQRIERYIQVVKEEIERLDQIATTTVKLAKGEVEARPMDFVNPGEVIHNIVEKMSPRLRAENCQPHFFNNIHSNCHIDITALERITYNLLDNAIKFAPCSLIEIHLSRDEQTLILNVRDYGLGLEKANPKAKGSAIGLKSIEYLAEYYHGSVHLENAHPGVRAIVRLNIKWDDV